MIGLIFDLNRVTQSEHPNTCIEFTFSKTFHGQINRHINLLQHAGEPVVLAGLLDMTEVILIGVDADYESLALFSGLVYAGAG